MNEWTSIEDKDRPVPLDADVLVYQADGNIYVAYLWTCHGRWKRNNAEWKTRCDCMDAEGSYGVEPIYWMPLPEAPK